MRRKSRVRNLPNRFAADGDGLHDKASAAVQLSTPKTNEKLENLAYVCGSRLLLADGLFRRQP
jgi:hypothetical protein